MKEAFLGIDTGSISTKGVIIDTNGNILARSYLWTEGNPGDAARRVVDDLAGQIDRSTIQVTSVGTTGSARRLVGAMLGAQVMKNEITAHAVGTTHLHPNVRTILEIGGQDSKIICVEDGVAVDYAMNTLCAAGTGSFLSSQAHRLGVEVEEFGEIALTSKKPANIAARCTVFAESDLVHKIQVGYPREDIIAGLCKAVVTNYLNNVGKGKKIVAPVVFQGGVSKNIGVVKSFEDALGMEVLVDPDGHLMAPMELPFSLPTRPKARANHSRLTWMISTSARARWCAKNAPTTARLSAYTKTISSSTPGAIAATKEPFILKP